MEDKYRTNLRALKRTQLGDIKQKPDFSLVDKVNKIVPLTFVCHLMQFILVVFYLNCCCLHDDETFDDDRHYKRMNFFTAMQVFLIQYMLWRDGHTFLNLLDTELIFLKLKQLCPELCHLEFFLLVTFTYIVPITDINRPRIHQVLFLLFYLQFHSFYLSQKDLISDGRLNPEPLVKSHKTVKPFSSEQKMLLAQAKNIR